MATQTQLPPNAISMSPETFVVGGLLDNVNAKVEAAKFQVWDYDGKGKPVLALKMELVDDEGNKATQYYSAGDPKNYDISANGDFVVPAAGSRVAGFNDSSNIAILLKNLINAGYPANRISPSAQATFVGLYGYWQRITVDRKIANQEPRQDGRPSTVLVCTKVNSMPGEKTATSTPTVSSNGDSGSSDTLMEEAVKFITAVLAEKGSLKKPELTGQIFAKMRTNARRQELTSLIFSDEFTTMITAAGIAKIENGVYSTP